MASRKVRTVWREAVSVRLSREELAMLRHLAAVSGISQSDVVRVLVKRAARDAEKFASTLV